MNKICNAFSNIKTSEELKEKTYQKIINKDYHTKNKKFNFLYFSLATSIILCVFLYNYSDKIKNTNPKNFTIGTESIGYEQDSITYNNNNYIIDNDTNIKSDMLNEELTFEVKDNNMEVYSTDSDSMKIYSIKNVDDLSKIAVLINGNITIYKLENKTNR